MLDTNYAVRNINLKVQELLNPYDNQTIFKPRGRRSNDVAKNHRRVVYYDIRYV